MKGKDESWPAKCSNPIDVTVLADYWLAMLDGSNEEAVEEHLFECDKCGERLRELIALAEGVRELARSGAASDSGVKAIPATPGGIESSVDAEVRISRGLASSSMNRWRSAGPWGSIGT